MVCSECVISFKLVTFDFRSVISFDICPMAASIFWLVCLNLGHSLSIDVTCDDTFAKLSLNLSSRIWWSWSSVSRLFVFWLNVSFIETSRSDTLFNPFVHWLVTFCIKADVSFWIFGLTPDCVELAKLSTVLRMASNCCLSVCWTVCNVV